MKIETLIGLLPQEIEAKAFRHHSKAGESYVDVIFHYDKDTRWEGSIPYYYRRTGTFIEDESTLSEFLLEAYEHLRPSNVSKWIEKEKSYWEEHLSNKEVTKPFFDKLLNLEWNSVYDDLPSNPNWARRIQDIKEMGYFLATDTNRESKKTGNKGTHILLVPLPKGAETGYEVFSPKLRKRIIDVLGSYDAYEGKVRPSRLLLPDHKYPEIAWDENTREDNPDDMSDDEIREKFQLLDNQRNLEKREACRKVVETGELGTIFGIEFYLNETGKWPEGVPYRGDASRDAWKLCPWYDIDHWRKELNKRLKKG